MKLEVILSPAELPALAERDLRSAACVVFDILRATSTFVTALQHGAAAVVPVAEIAEAVALRRQHPDWLLAGERHGLKIRAAEAAGFDFDLGNSPREFTPATVGGRTIISTTTNGTRALRAAGGAGTVMAASFLNLAATARYLQQLAPTEILLVCAGTGEGVAGEDVLAAGALSSLLAGDRALSDAAQIARQFYRSAQNPLEELLGRTANGQRLLSLPDLRADVAWCAQVDTIPLVALADDGGQLRGHLIPN